MTTGVITLINELQKLLILRLYQVDEKSGYLCKSDIDEKFPSSVFSNDCTEMEIIVKFKPFMALTCKATEVLTGETFDLVSFLRKPGTWSEYYKYLKKSEYDTFAFLVSYYRTPNMRELENYVNEHQDIEAYKEYLKALKVNGEQMHKQALIREREKLIASNEKVKRLIKR